MRKAIYFPALSCGTTTYIRRGLTENIVKSPQFYNPDVDSHFYYPYTLWSAAHHYKIEGFRKDMSLGKTNVFIDSGGYQLATGVISEKKYNNSVALDWSEKNGDIFPILDRPLTPNCNFDDNLRVSIESAKYYYENRSHANKVILNVVSARDMGEFEEWYKGISPISLDGWAHGGHRSNMKTILQGLMFMFNKGEFTRDRPTIYHIFGVTRCDAMLYFAYIQHQMTELGANIQITYDSSSFQRNLAYGGWWSNMYVTGAPTIHFSNKYNYDNMPANATMPCRCPVCSTITNVKKYLTDSHEFYMLGVLHNLKIQLDYKNFVDSLVAMNVPEMFNDLPSVITKNLATIRSAFLDPLKGSSIVQRNYINKDFVAESTAAPISKFMKA